MYVMFLPDSLHPFWMRSAILLMYLSMDRMTTGGFAKLSRPSVLASSVYKPSPSP